MVNREDQHMVIGRSVEADRPGREGPCTESKGSLKISFASSSIASSSLCGGRKLPKTKIGFAALTNHLQRPLFARKKREAQNLLPFDYSLKGRFAGLLRDDALATE